jgi:acyl dehydratase
MESNARRVFALLQQRTGQEESTGAWHRVDQRQIDAFADATLDRQFIHVDPVLCAQHSPYQVPIAHGFLTLSLLPHLTSSLARPMGELTEGLTATVNYGLDRVRFPSPVRVDSRVRARVELLGVELIDPNTVQIKRKVTIEIEHATKPACVAETLSRLIYA